MLGLWDDILGIQSHLLEPLNKPEHPQGYVLSIQEHVLLTANSRDGLLNGVQTLIQILAACPSRTIPGMIIEDHPRCQRRSLVYDAQSFTPKVDHLLQVTGLLSSFKVNTLHLILGLTSGQSFSAADAEQLYEVSSEYGIDVVPWLNLPKGLAEGGLDVDGAVESILGFLDVFTAHAIGIAPVPLHEKSGVEELATVIRAADIQLPEESRLYLHAEVALDLISTGTEIPTRCICTIQQGEESEEQLESLTRHGAEVVLFIPSTRDHFVPATKTERLHRCDSALKIIRNRVLTEIGFWCEGQRMGHLFQHDLIPAIAGMTAGWGGDQDGETLEQRFACFAYGEAGAGIIQQINYCAEVMPPQLRGPEALSFRSLAFGAKPDSESIRRAGEVNWAEVESRLYSLDEALRACRREVQRNIETLEFLDILPLSLRFLMTYYTQFNLASEHYASAMQGKAGSIGEARKCLAEIVRQLPILQARIEAAKAEFGAFVEELQSLSDLQERLVALDEQLASLTRSEQLPPAQEVGLLEVGNLPPQ